MHNQDEIFHAFARARQARSAVRATSAEDRIARLQSLRASLTAHVDDIGAAIHDDLGRPTDNRGEYNTVMGNIDKAVSELADWMAPVPVEQSIPGPKSKRIFVQYEPRGVVLLFGTWDFPIGMFFSPLVQAVAAGNVVIAKTNSMAPATGALIAQIAAEVFPPEEVTVFTDSDTATQDGVRDTNDVLLDLPVDHIFLTGSPRVGKLIVAAAAKHLATFTLELGGKSPAIVDDTADLDYVAAQVVAGKIPNHGQTCLSVDYLWLPTARRAEFVEKYVAAVQEQYYEDGVFQWHRDGRFVDKRNFDRVKGYLDQAVARGAVVAFGGSSDADALIIEPTVLLDLPGDCDIIREEIFGPILPILAYDDESQIWAHSDSLGKPLGLFIYSNDDAFVERVLGNTSSGGVTVNAHNVHWREENLPFGGVNSSGYGRYHGVWGFREFSNARSVYQVDIGLGAASPSA